jgi:putative membrane protein
MIGLLLRWLIITAGIIIAAHLFHGITLDGYQTAFIAAALLRILTLPLNILTLGLFTFVINGVLLWLVSVIISGFHIAGIFPSLAGALLIWAVALAASIFIR